MASSRLWALTGPGSSLRPLGPLCREGKPDLFDHLLEDGSASLIVSPSSGSSAKSFSRRFVRHVLAAHQVPADLLVEGRRPGPEPQHARAASSRGLLHRIITDLSG